MSAPSIAIGSTLGAVGTVMGVTAQAAADRAAANAEEQNAKFFMEQAAFEAQASEREQDIFKRETTIRFGEQVSSFAKAGVDISGSPLLVLADSKRVSGTELGAIKREGEFRVRQRILQAKGATANARAIRSGIAGRQIGGLLTGAGNLASGFSRIRKK